MNSLSIKTQDKNKEIPQKSWYYLRSRGGMWVVTACNDKWALVNVETGDYYNTPGGIVDIFAEHRSEFTRFTGEFTITAEL